MADSAPSGPTDSRTTCARPAAPIRSATPPLAPPIQLSSVFEFADLALVDSIYGSNESGFIYARDGHPNAAQLAEKIARIEGGEAAVICASGMAAESAIFLAHLQAGDRVAISAGLYGRTTTLVAGEMARFGVKHDLFDATDPESLRAVLTPATRVVFTETLSNPLLRLADIAGLAAVTRPRGALLAIDHTFAPLLCRPLALGADVVTHSVTKSIGGHSDVTLGALVGRSDWIKRTARVASTFGLTGNPFDSWLALRGMATLAVRTERACANALDLARRLEKHPAVARVHYPGLPSHPDHALATRTMTGGFGAIVTFDVDGRSEADRLIQRLRHIPYAPSLGDVSTSLSHPTTTSHRSQTPEQWVMQGITPGLIRLSVGIEAVDDLWDDLENALG